MSIKSITTNPWEDINVKYPVGSIIMESSGIKEYGIFLEIEKGIDGLVHSDLSWSKRDKNQVTCMLTAILFKQKLKISMFKMNVCLLASKMSMKIHG